MGMATAGTLMSAEEFDSLPVEESQGFELFEGELVEMSTPTPVHSDIEAALVASLRSFLAARGKGRLWLRTEFAFSKSRYQPDLALFVDDRWKEHTAKVPVPIAPDIAVEVISPSESATKVERKRKTYLSHGVKEVWMVYPDELSILVYSAAGLRVVEMPDQLTTPLLPEWSQPLTDIFSICL